MIITVFMQDAALARYAAALDTASRQVRVEMSKGLNEGGYPVLRDVRRALKRQMNTRSVAPITKATKPRRATPGSLQYVINGTGRGLLIQDHFAHAVGRQVTSDPWARAHSFQRSFRNGALMARLTAKRYPVRYLYGPSPPKELVQDESLATFQSGVPRTVYPAIARRLSALLGGL